MLPLTVNDLLSLEDYVPRRREYFDSHRRYVDRYRRVRIGPRLTLIFENRQTLWFRVQEIVRVARLSDPIELQQELELYNRLLPGPDLLQAALLIEVNDETRLLEELTHFRDLDGDHLALCVGDDKYASELITCRSEDRCVGTAHWVQFHILPEQRRRLEEFSLPAHFAFSNAYYSHKSASLTDDLRQSLVDDLLLSERDEVRAVG